MTVMFLPFFYEAEVVLSLDNPEKESHISFDTSSRRKALVLISEKSGVINQSHLSLVLWVWNAGLWQIMPVCFSNILR